MKLSTSLSLAIFTSLSSFTSSVSAAWPDAPFFRDGRWIVNSAGENVTFAGVNWPGAADTMLPEGLQYASIADTISKIKSIGMNVIRLTFAIEMIDDIYTKGADTTLRDTLVNALGSTNGTKVLNQILAKNPSFTASTTRLQVFDAVASAAAAQEVYVHLDNHVSKAQWCCGTTDGNAWFGDTYFNVDNWKRGLAYMVAHAASWPNFVSIGLRNEPRQGTSAAQAYTWANWYTNMVAAATAVHNANPNTLIFFSGLGYDTDLSDVVDGDDLGNGVRWNIESFAFSNKIVYELHNYQTTATSCSSIQSTLVNGGFDALTTAANKGPVVVTEFGFNNADSTYTSVYATCLKSYLPSVHVGWMVWTISGSYYIREGTQDSDDTWGILNHDWSGWRNTAAITNGLRPMVAATLA